MDIDEPIPSSLYIKQTQTYMYILYDNQTQTCNKCGHIGHQIKDCHTSADDKLNILDLDDLIVVNDVFDIESNVDSVDTNHIDENLDASTNVDIHLDPTQGKKRFECTECEYKCDYENILKVHMETHKATSTEPKQHLGKYIKGHKVEKTFPCTECDYTCSSDGALKDHMRIHTGGKTYKCNNCEYSFTLEAELNIHMKNHTGETLIDASFAQINSSLSVLESTPKRQSSSISTISASQPCNAWIEHPNRLSKRSLSVSPEVTVSYKKTTNDKSAKSSNLRKPVSRGNNKKIM